MSDLPPLTRADDPAGGTDHVHTKLCPDCQAHAQRHAASEGEQP